jgi:hypothetical protein
MNVELGTLTFHSAPWRTAHYLRRAVASSDNLVVESVTRWTWFGPVFDITITGFTPAQSRVVAQWMETMKQRETS